MNSPTRMLVTGATGFVGGAAARRLKRLGHSVSTTGRSLAKGGLLRADGLAFSAADLADRDAVMALVEGQEVVVHSAALASPWGLREAFWSANVTAVEHIVEACRVHGVRRLVHISTPAVHAARVHRRNVPEDAPWGPAFNLYIETKREAELRVRASGLSHIMLRPRGVFGPGDNAVLPRIVRALEAGRLPLIDGGEHEIDLTYIDNLSQAIERACFVEGVDAGAFHIANGEPRRVVDLLHALCARLELPRPTRNLSYALAYRMAAVVETAHRWLPLGEPTLTRYGITAIGRGTTLDLTAARRDLGYAPEVDLDEGLERFASWWESQTPGLRAG